VSINPAELAAIKVKLAADRKFLRPARDSLIEGADKALKQRPLSVLDKKKSVAGADAHDYVSYAPYFWPDPDKPDGLPYVRRDGKRNDKLIRQGDAVNFQAVKQPCMRWPSDTTSLATPNTRNTRRRFCGPGSWIPGRG